jgi:arabinose-5-phosphate isomerase
VSVEVGRRVLRAEAMAVARLADELGEPFRQAVQRVIETRGRVVLTGMGKSGIVARKIGATLASTGTPALFIHPAEAHHGDLGMVAEGDLVLALSNSGETQEVLTLLDTIRRLGARLMVMTGRPGSTLAREADVLLDTSVPEEGCPLGLAPMASTTAALALGDALAAAVMEAKGFGEEDFARLHPGGRLGRRLSRVSQFMHKGDAVPRVPPQAPMKEALIEMSRKRLGCTTVVSPDGALLGIITDGDLRRLLETDDAPLGKTAGEVMTPEPRTVTPDVLAAAALRIMEERKITMLPVVESGALTGLVQIHDLWGTQLF